MENIDAKIIKLFEVVKIQREEVAQAEKKSSAAWRTNCTITIGQFSQPQNILSANESKIKQILMDILVQQDYAQRASKILGIAEDNKYQNFLYEDWITDCQKRISIIQLKAKKQKLDELEERLNAIVSPEQKRQMELAKIEASLGI